MNDCTCTDAAAEAGYTSTLAPVMDWPCQPGGSFTTVRLWTVVVSGNPDPKSLVYQVDPPERWRATAKDDTLVPLSAISMMAYWRASPACNDAGSVDPSSYQRATSSPITW